MLKSDLVHRKISPQALCSFIPSSQQKTTAAAEKKSPVALGIPAQQRKHPYKTYSNSREKVESED